MKNPVGILLINLGTPDAPNKKAIRRYLREFLSDPRVIDLPAMARWLLLNCFILPFRPKQTSHAYQQIWTPQGSPLLLNSQQLSHALQEKLGTDFCVRLGMRYGSPSLSMALHQLQQQRCEKIIILPLFPQYSSAASGSAIEKTLSIIKQWHEIPDLEIITDFYQHPAFIHAQQQVIQTSLKDFNPDLLLFSYHGLPERQLNQTNCHQSECNLKTICPRSQAINRFCYRHQCYVTSEKIAEALGLEKSQYVTSFQSRLGKTPWIRPYTDEQLKILAKHGIKKLAIVCPSFVADCLETLEEIGIRAKKQWLDTTGNEFKLIPCLNAETTWVSAITTMIKERSI